ncbi:hypothetical protein H1C71_035673 [Ictidomys tridecemlineatus]|nr:hypothetical protein H1C71_035673 [Ictidomys tridecemlineatus]
MAVLEMTLQGALVCAGPGFSVTWQGSLQTLLALTCCLAHAGHSECRDDQNEAPPFRPAGTTESLGIRGPSQAARHSKELGYNQAPCGLLSAQGTRAPKSYSWDWSRI